MNDDQFRQHSRSLTVVERNRITRLKNQASDLLNTIQLEPRTREQSLAVTKLEECVMWAVKGITG